VSDLADVRERLARIETKLDLLIPLEKRLRTVEQRQNWGSGVFAAVSALLGYSISLKH